MKFRALGLAALAATVMPLAAASAVAQEIVVRIEHVRALDVIDAASPADFAARVTIGNQTFTLGPVKDQNEIRPQDWVVRHRVTGGEHPIKLEVFDKDVTLNDPVDINRIEGKRHLDFAVNTNTCVVSGFAQPYRCGSRIVRAGTERKKAEVTFRVEVR